jgi:hypothetical protein
MGGSTRFAFVVLALAAAPAGLVSGQERANAAAVPQREVVALRDRIARLPAATVDTSVVMAAPETESAATASAAGTGATSIRSVSTGKAVITASGPAFTEASAQVEFLFPTRFLAAGILGGLAGGALRLGVPRRGAGRRVLAKLGLSVICGAIVFALYALGANVIGFKLPGRAGELVVFVVAALGALGGVGLLKTPASQKP